MKVKLTKSIVEDIDVELPFYARLDVGGDSFISYEYHRLTVKEHLVICSNIYSCSLKRIEVNTHRITEDILNNECDEKEFNEALTKVKNLINSVPTLPI